MQGAVWFAAGITTVWEQQKEIEISGERHQLSTGSRGSGTAGSMVHGGVIHGIHPPPRRAEVCQDGVLSTNVSSSLATLVPHVHITYFIRSIYTSELREVGAVSRLWQSILFAHRS